MVREHSPLLKWIIKDIVEYVQLVQSVVQLCIIQKIWLKAVVWTSLEAETTKGKCTNSLKCDVGNNYMNIMLK